MNLDIFILALISLGAIFIFASFFGLIFLFKSRIRLLDRTKVSSSPGYDQTSPAVPVPAESSFTGEEKPRDRGPGLKQIYLPLGVLALSVVLILIFAPQLSQSIAYRFGSGGAPIAYTGKALFITLVLGGQLFLVLGGWLVGFSVDRVARSQLTPASRVRVNRIAGVIANFVVLPQLFIAFIMADLFSYNVSSVHLMPIWLFAVIVMVTGMIIISFFFVREFLKNR